MGGVDEGTAGDGGLLDVHGLSFAELAALLSADDLERALDRILGEGAGTGYHGFNNHI